MKFFIAIITLLVSIYLFPAADDIDPLARMKGPYLGQQQPGMEAVIFAPGILCRSGSIGTVVFFEEGRKLLYKRWSPERILYFTYLNGDHWEKPAAASFFMDPYDGDFAMSPDGTRVYFASPAGAPTSEARAARIWTSRLTDTQWSKPEILPEIINTGYHESYPSVTEDGTLYFFSRKPGGRGQSDIYRSRLVNGVYQEPENLGETINTEEHEWDPYIAPDESFLIFCSKKPGGLGEDDIYITFRNEDGSWCVPIHMGDNINTSRSENRPVVTADGRYLFFTSDRKLDDPSFQQIEEKYRPVSGDRHVYWVDAKIIGKYRPKK